MFIISARFIYLLAALCATYLSLAPFLTSIRGAITVFMVILWIGTLLLFFAALTPSSRENAMIALTGSALTMVLVLYDGAKFVAFRLGYIHATSYHPSTFDHVYRIVGKPIIVALFVSSVISLVVSAFALGWRATQPRQL